MPQDESIPAKPVFLFDGDCGLCRYWTQYWQQLTTDRVVYRPFASSTTDQFSSQLLDIDGRVYRGAYGIVKLLSFAPHRSWLLWFYTHVRFVSLLSEWAYHQVSRCRGCAAKMTMWLFGVHPKPSSYILARRFFFGLTSLTLVVALLFSHQEIVLSATGLLALWVIVGAGVGLVLDRMVLFVFLLALHPSSVFLSFVHLIFALLLLAPRRLRFWGAAYVLLWLMILGWLGQWSLWYLLLIDLLVLTFDDTFFKV
ncbi:DUF393 domain-containing protein [Candidatus Uhrbacteria bacterium]|nr:DUF393 domain-containing protein [Candidatus Uhrbacteria bacterium]